MPRYRHKFHDFLENVLEVLLGFFRLAHVYSIKVAQKKLCIMCLNQHKLLKMQLHAIINSSFLSALFQALNVMQLVQLLYIESKLGKKN